MGNCEHDVEVAGVEQLLLPCLKPSLANLGLELGAVAVAAGVIGDAGLMTASQTHVEVTAECGGAAAGDGTERLQLLIAEAGPIAFQEPVALLTEDVGHLHGGPAHG